MHAKDNNNNNVENSNANNLSWADKKLWTQILSSSAGPDCLAGLSQDTAEQS